MEEHNPHSVVNVREKETGNRCGMQVLVHRKQGKLCAAFLLRVLSTQKQNRKNGGTESSKKNFLSRLRDQCGR